MPHLIKESIGIENEGHTDEDGIVGRKKFMHRMHLRTSAYENFAAWKEQLGKRGTDPENNNKGSPEDHSLRLTTVGGSALVSGRGHG